MSAEETFQKELTENQRLVSLESWMRSWNLTGPAEADHHRAARDHFLDHSDGRQYDREIDWESRIKFYAEYCERRRLSDRPEERPTSDECARVVADSEVRLPAEGTPDAESPRPETMSSNSSDESTERYCTVEPLL